MISATSRKRVLAPGPRGNLLMGNLEQYKRDPITMLLRLQQEYGDVARNQLGPFLTHGLAHPDHVKYVLQENHRNYVRGRFYDNFKMFFGDGLLTTEGDFWRRHRRAVQPLFHKKAVLDHTGIVGAAVMDLVEQWKQLPPDKPVEVVEEMLHLSLSVLGRMVFNVDISHHARTVGPAVRFGLKAMMAQGNLNDFIPRWVPTPFNLRIREARNGINTIIGQIIEDHRNGKCETSDAITLLLQSRHPDTGEPMTEQEIHDEVMTLFLAGHETTGSGLGWALYAMAQHPFVMRQLREELDMKLGGRAPTSEDLDDLPYLDQVVNEILRIYPPIWGYTRDLVDDDEIGGYHIPAGSSIFVSPYVTHRHPEFWHNAEAFDPENFASNAPVRHKFAYFPFGGGMRKCIGVQTALLQMRIVVAVVAQHLDLSALPGHSVERGGLLSLRPIHGIKLLMKPRVRTSAGQPSRPGQAEATCTASTEPEPAVEGRCPFAGKGAALALAPITEAAVPSAPAPCAESVTSVTLMSEISAADAPSADTPISDAAPVPVRRFTWHPSETAQLPIDASPDLAGKRIAIVNGRTGTAERVAAALARACAKAFIFAPSAEEDVTTAALVLTQAAGPFDGIIDLTLETPFALNLASAWEAPMARSVALLQANYKEWQEEEATSRLFYMPVTWLDGRMGFAASEQTANPHGGQPLGGLWAGLAKTLPQELPNCNVRVLDISPDDAGQVERYIVSELYRWGLFEVGYHHGRRYTLEARHDEIGSVVPMRLAPGDVVLFSGGARGIGLLCARAVAQRFGATIIITGREQAPADGEVWLTMDDDQFKLYGQEQLRQATPRRMPAAIRKELAQLQKRRELHATLREIEAANLPIHYRVCDITEPAAVQALCDEFGEKLKMIVHNAGVDRPIRLSGKSIDGFIDIVRTKVLGFANLCAAAAGKPQLVQFCNVGSLTGRMGGMTGETDYAAANEALARLGLWAQRNALSCSVKTLVWPTWEGVGMITNFDVTKRYVTPIALDDGVRHWLREMADPGSGEVMFIGAVGRALTPIQITGINPIDLPNIAQLITLRHHAGHARQFRPFARFATRYRIDPRDAPFLSTFRLDGRPACPASMLIDHACILAHWVNVEDFRPLALASLVNIKVDLDALVLPRSVDGALVIESEAVGYWLGSDWHVDVHCTDPVTKRELLRLTVVRSSHAQTVPAPLLPWPEQDSMAPTAQPVLQRPFWNSSLLRGAEWRTVSAGPAMGTRIGHVSASEAADLWALPHPPELRLPVNHIENALRAAWPECDAGISHLNIEHIVFGPASAASARLIIAQPNGRICITDDAGTPVIELHGLALTSANPPAMPMHAPSAALHSSMVSSHEQ